MTTSIQVSRVPRVLVHRRRVYEVFIDAEPVGHLSQVAWLGEYAVSPGRHLVQTRSGRHASQVVAVVVEEGQTASLTCAARPLVEAVSRSVTDPARSLILRDDAWESTALPHRLPFGWRVTRYDPALRDEHGAYTGNAWTSISDIDGGFEDGVLTGERYEATEKEYLDAVTAFAAEAGITRLQIRDPGDAGASHGGHGHRPLVHGEVVPIAEAVEIVRDVLRGLSWCRLEAPTDDFTVHVGSDFYLYIGSTNPCSHAVAEVSAGDLFVEPFGPDEGSPYIPNDGWLRPYE